MLDNGQWQRWVKDAEDACYGPGGPEKATEWQQKVFLADMQIKGMSAAFEQSVGVAKREVMQAIHAVSQERPEARSRSRRKDMVIRIGIPTVGGGAVFVGLIELIRRLAG